MTSSSYASEPSNNRSLAYRPSQRQPERRTHGTVVSRSQPNQAAPPSPSYLPSDDEMDRMERWLAIQERMAKVNSRPRQGHTYGKVTVSGNARVIRGNLYDESASPSSFSQHTYGDGIVREGGMIWDGDVSVSSFKR